MDVIQDFKWYLRELNNGIFKAVSFAYLIVVSCYVNGGELTKGTSSSSGLESKKDNSGVIKFNDNQFSNDTDILNNFGIIQDTNFSKEVELLRPDKTISPVGFTNKIVLTTGIDYDSNPALVGSQKNPAWIYTFSPQLLLDYVGEFNRVYLDSALLIQRPSNEAVLPDREDPRLTIGWDRTYESGSFGMYANYLQILSRAQEVRTTGAFVITSDRENTQRSKAFGVNWEHNLDQRWSLLTNADFRKEVFSGGVNLLGSRTLDVRSSLSYEFNERLKTYTQLGYIKISPDGSVEDTTLKRLTLGADYLISDSLRGAFRGSKNYISGSQSDSQWAAGAKFTYEIERMEFSTELNRELGTAGGVGSFQKTDTLALGWAFNISERDSISAAYSIVKFASDEQAGLIGQRFKQFNAGYNRILPKNWNARANLSYRELIPDSGGEIVESAIFGVSLIYNGLSF